MYILPFPIITSGLIAVTMRLAAWLTRLGSGHASGGSGQIAVWTTLLPDTRWVNIFPGKSKYDTPVDQ